MSTATVAAVAGAGGGVLAQLITYPLQTVNTRQQTERKLLKLSDTDARKPEASRNTFQQFIKIINEEGPGSLYQGLGSSIVGTAASQFVYYFAYQSGRDWATDRNRKSIGTLTSLVVAAASGCINVLLTNPIWVLVCRLQTEKQAREAKLQRLAESAGRYERETGAFDRTFVEKPVTTTGTIAEIYREAGIVGFWKGVLPALVMVSNPAIQFMIYETLLDRVTAKRRLTKAGIKKATAGEIFLLGSVAKLGATLVTYPLLVIKSRLQAKQDIGTDDFSKYSGTLDAVAKMLKYEGILSFYKGMDLKIVQSVLASAILFMTKEELMKFALVLMRSNRRQKLIA